MFLRVNKALNLSFRGLEGSFKMPPIFWIWSEETILKNTKSINYREELGYKDIWAVSGLSSAEKEFHMEEKSAAACFSLNFRELEWENAN